jgi:hypothetical protein
VTDLLPTPTPTAKPTVAQRLVERVSSLLETRSTRRRFLLRAAMVGSALSVDPLGYALKPGTAYASVCGSANTCGAGWSVFCCTINDGANTCPDYSFAAGWWKVDASAFCLGAPRYYIDCNRRPSGSCSCRCNRSGCDRRRVCCNVFRYGQCNTQIRGVTQVVCRIITCTPPWEWDRRCGRSVRTEQATASHTSTCLPGRNPSRIEIRYQDLGLVGSVLGKPVAKERSAQRGGRTRRYAKGVILWHRDHGAHEVHGWMGTRYVDSGAEGGPLGYPRTGHRSVGDRSGQIVRFERGTMYRKFGGATTIVLTRADRRYRKLGGPRGRLGYPTSDTQDAAGSGSITRFERGAIFMSPRTDAVEVTGRALTVYENAGGSSGPYGFPVTAMARISTGGRKQRFEGGLLIGPNPRRIVAVRDVIRHRWMGEMKGQTGPWGFAVNSTGGITGREGLWNAFQHAIVYWSPETGVRWFSRGPIYRQYRREGGAAGRLGFPTADERTVSDGRVQVTFQHGVITHDPRTGETTVED